MSPLLILQILMCLTILIWIESSILTMRLINGKWFDKIILIIKVGILVLFAFIAFGGMTFPHMQALWQ